jgi:hypothetical protein
MGDMMMRLVRSSEPSLTGVNSPDFSGIGIFLSKTTYGLWRTSDAVSMLINADKRYNDAAI